MRLFAGTPFDRPPQCDRCGQLESDCRCQPQAALRTPPGKQTARIRTEKRKKGKLVTVVRGLLDEGDHLAELLTSLKNHCGAGGTLEEGVLEIQGDQVGRVAAQLDSLGYRVKEE